MNSLADRSEADTAEEGIAVEDIAVGDIVLRRSIVGSTLWRSGDGCQMCSLWMLG